MILTQTEKYEPYKEFFTSTQAEILRLSYVIESLYEINPEPSKQMTINTLALKKLGGLKWILSNSIDKFYEWIKTCIKTHLNNEGNNKIDTFERTLKVLSEGLSSPNLTVNTIRFCHIINPLSVSPQRTQEKSRREPSPAPRTSSASPISAPRESVKAVQIKRPPTPTLPKILRPRTSSKLPLLESSVAVVSPLTPSRLTFKLSKSIEQAQLKSTLDPVSRAVSAFRTRVRDKSVEISRRGSIGRGKLPKKRVLPPTFPLKKK